MTKRVCSSSPCLRSVPNYIDRSLRNRLHFRVMAFLSGSLLITIVCFFAVTIFQKKLSPPVCKIFGMTLHASVLITFGWMMLQAVLVYKNLVVVLVSANNFLWKHSGPVIRESIFVAVFFNFIGVTSHLFPLFVTQVHNNYPEIDKYKPDYIRIITDETEISHPLSSTISSIKK